MLVDFHTHTVYSNDYAFMSPEEVVCRAKEAGLDAIALTDHNTCAGISKAQYYGEREGVLVIPGVELSVKERRMTRHVIGLGIYESSLPIHRPLSETIDWIHNHGGIAIAPHPFQFYGVKCKVKEFDGVEVHNSWGDRLADRRAQAMAERMSKPQICGSDAHTVETVGYGVTRVESERSVEGIIRAIRAGRTTIQRCRYVSFNEAFEIVDRYFSWGDRLKIKIIGTILYALLTGSNLCGISRDILYQRIFNR